MNIIYSACFAIVFVNVLQMHRNLRINRKPFSCEICMAGWTCLFLSIKPEWWFIPFEMCCAMVLTRILVKLTE